MDKPFVYQDIEYNTVENFYQAMKLETADLENRKKISEMGPFESKREISNFKLRKDWDLIKLDVMELVLRHKFKPGTSWHKKLIETEGEIIENNNWGDVFWGYDVNLKTGENHLGKILTKIRDSYKLKN